MQMRIVCKKEEYLQYRGRHSDRTLSAPVVSRFLRQDAEREWAQQSPEWGQ